MKFIELDFPGILHEDLCTRNESVYRNLSQAIEEAWSLAPEPMQIRFKELSGTNFIAYRGLIFELYILRTLLKSGYMVTYEPGGSQNKGPIDFLAEKGTTNFLVEVTSIGPNEEGILNPSYDINPEGFLKVRKALRDKLNKVSEPPKLPTILALCNSFESFLSTPFEKVQALYGVPAVRFNRENKESTMVLSDRGIWAEEPIRTRWYSAAYFTKGKYPGFTFSGQPELWMNPSAEIELDPSFWPEDAVFYKSDENLYRTSKHHNYEWAKVNSIF